MNTPNHVANIGTAEKRKRLIFGLFALLLGVLLLSVGFLFDVSRWWRILLVVPFYLTGLGIFQAKEET